MSKMISYKDGNIQYRHTLENGDIALLEKLLRMPANTTFDTKIKKATIQGDVVFVTFTGDARVYSIPKAVLLG